MTTIAVVGGGPAGCALAVTAARCGHEVVVYDEGRRLRSWPGESLPAGAGELVASVFGPEVLEGHAKAFGTAAAWGSAELVSHDYMSHWSGHGWHLGRAVFDDAVRAVAVGLGVRLEHRRITSPDEMSADWIVDASGRAGVIVSRLGVPRVRLDDQVALVGVVADRGGERVTTVEAVRDGWWYTTPLPNGTRVAALVTDSHRASRRSDLWLESLATTVHVADLTGDVRRVEVSAYPADTTYRLDVVGDGWLAVGDAAACFDPLSSQGLLTGIVMGARAGALLGGDLTGWAEDYRAIVDEHIALRSDYLRAEDRWPAAPFWQRRRAALVEGTDDVLVPVDERAGHHA